MALSDLQKMVAGMFYPAQPAANASIYDLARADAQRQSLSGLGAGLLAAAVPQTPMMRAQALQQAFGSMGNMGTNVYNAAQARLMAQQAESAARRDKLISERASAILGGLPTAIGTAPTAPVVPPVDAGVSVAPSQGPVQINPQVATITAPQPPSAAPLQFSDTDKIRLQNAAALGDEEVIKVYNEIVEEKAKPKGGGSDYLSMSVMRQPDGSYAYVQPSKTGGPPLILGPAPAPGEEEKAIVEQKAKGEIMAFQPKANRALVRTEGNALNVVNAATEALNIIRNSNFATGKTGKLASNVPGTDAYNLSRLLDTVKANVGFNELQSMREASPTGGALGQVAVQELESLQATKGSLDIGQDAELLEKSLMNIIADTDNTVNSMYDAYERDYGAGSVSREPLYDLSAVYAAPPEAIDVLRQNANDPAARRAFDRQFGKGAAKYILGVQ